MSFKEAGWMAVGICLVAGTLARAADTAPAPFIPKGGKIVATAKLAEDTSKDTSDLGGLLKWDASGQNVLFVGGADLEILNLKTGLKHVAVPKEADWKPFPGEYGRQAEWMDGGRIIVRNYESVWILDAAGEPRKVYTETQKDWKVQDYALSSSRDGKFAVFTIGPAAWPHRGICVVAADSGDAHVVTPPMDPAADAEMKLFYSDAVWNAEGKLALSACWSKKMTPWENPVWIRWLYDPATNTFTKLGLGSGAMTPGWNFPQDLGAETKILWSLPGEKTLRRILAAGASEPSSQGINPMKTQKINTGAAAAVEILDGAEKVLRRIELDQVALDHADIWPIKASSDGRYLLVTTFKELQYSAGAPHSSWTPLALKSLVLDLESGKVAASFSEPVGNVNDAEILSASREILDVDAPYIDERSYSADVVQNMKKKRGVWSIPFEGERKNWASESALPDGWARSSMVRYMPARLARRLDSGAPTDRVALIARPQHFIRAPGARLLLVCFNQARPIKAYVSKGYDDRPNNAEWSRDGSLLAFTAGDSIQIWQATAEPGEPEGPAGPGNAPKTGDF